MSTKRRKATTGTYWRGDTLWGRVTINGRKIRWSLGTNDPAIAKTRREAGRVRLLAEKHGDAVRTFAEVYAAWDGWIDGSVGSLDTADRYRCSLAQIAPWMEGKTLAEINGKLVSAIITGRQRAGISNATIKRDMTALSSVIKFSILNEWRDDNPVLAKLDLAPERRDPIVLPVERDIELVISRAPPTTARLIRAAIKTGAREAELIKSVRDHIDHDRRQMTIVGKRNKLRVIDLQPFDGYGFISTLPVRLNCKWLFWHRDGKSYSLAAFPGNFSALVRETAAWAAENGVEFTPFRFHDLRHWHAVNYLKDGYGTIYDLQGRLGHTSVKTTEIYLEYLTPEESQAAKFGRAGAQKGTQQVVGARGDVKKDQ